MRLYIEGHSHRLGYAVQVEMHPDIPPRFYRRNLRWVRRLVERFNRRFDE